MLKAIRSRLGATVSLKLSIVVLALTALVGAVITSHQTRQMEEMTLEKAKLAAAAGARQYGDTLDTAIDGGQLSVQDAFDRTYVPIKGYDWGNKPKFHTRYDLVTDQLLLRMQDSIQQHGELIFAIGVDDHGYIPTHNGKFLKPITGDPAKDLEGHRGKILASYPVGLAAATNLEPTLVQVYKRDTGQTVWDVSSPIFVKGKHWGGFRVGVSMERIAQRQRSLLVTLTAMFALFVVVTVGSMFLVVHAAMKPVRVLTAAAEQISLGEALETPIKPGSIDEIGKLTKAVDRLRASMKAAMSRLGH